MNFKSYLNQFIKRRNFSTIAVLTLCVFFAIIIIITLIYNYLPIHTTKTATVTDLDSLYKIGQTQIARKDYKNAIQTLTTVGEFASSGHTKADSILAVKAYNSAGVVSFFNNNYPSAYSFYKRAVDAGGSSHAYYVKTNLAIIHKMFNDIDNTEKLLKSAFHDAKKANDTVHLITAYYNILNMAMLDGVNDSVSDMIAFFRSLKIPGDKNWTYMNKISDGVDYFLNNRNSRAIQTFKEAENLAADAKRPERALIDCNMFIAQSFFKSNKPDSALVYFSKAIMLSDNESMRDHLPDIIWRMTQCYDALGRNSDALQSKVKYYKLRDSLSSYKDLTAIKNLDSDYNGRKYENKIAVIVAEKQKEKYRYFTAIVFLVITLGLLAITLNQKRKLKKSNILLFNKNIELLKSIEESKSEFLANKDVSVEVHFQKVKNFNENPVIKIIKNPDEQHQEIDNKQDDPQSGGIINFYPQEQARIRDEIKNFFYTSNEYLSPDFNMKRLCEIVGSNRMYVSYVINNLLGTSFHSLVNEYRINEAKIRLLDNAKDNKLTIESIAESLGYKSRSNFTKNFKAITGLTPSEFITIAKTTSSSNS